MAMSAVILMVSGVLAFTMACILLFTSRIFPRDMYGLKYWVASPFLFFLAVPLLLLRGVVPDFVSIIVANFLILLTAWSLSNGSRAFIKLPPLMNNRMLILFLLSYITLFCFFTYIDNNLIARNLINSLFILVFFTDLLHVIWVRYPKSNGRVVLLFASLILFLVIIFRIGIVFFGFDQSQHLFDNSTERMLGFATPAIIIPLMTIGCFMAATERLIENLQFINRHDELTGILNKKAAMEQLDLEVDRAKRYQSALSLMLLDLDKFKDINDIHGHLVGDQVILDFVDKTKKCLRKTDQFSRFGGDEFMATLPDTDINQAITVAKRIHKASKDGMPIPWTVSIGVSQFLGKDDLLDLIFARADKALYKAKAFGRNQTQVE